MEFFLPFLHSLNVSQFFSRFVPEIPPVLSHCDLYNKNVVFSTNEDGQMSDELLAIIDWQFAHAGNCMLDIAAVGSLPLWKKIPKQLKTAQILRVNKNVSDHKRFVEYYYEVGNCKLQLEWTFNCLDIYRGLQQGGAKWRSQRHCRYELCSKFVCTAILKAVLSAAIVVSNTTFRGFCLSPFGILETSTTLVENISSIEHHSR